MLRIKKKSVYMPPVHEDYRVLHGFVKIPSIGQAKTGKNPAIPRIGDRVIGQSSGSTCKRGKTFLKMEEAQCAKVHSHAVC